MAINKVKPGPITPDIIKKARADAGLTQAQAAELIHVSIHAWRKWENGQREMPLMPFDFFLLKAGLGDWFHYLGTVNID